jgi:hypothetical protein
MLLVIQNYGYLVLSFLTQKNKAGAISSLSRVEFFPGPQRCFVGFCQGDNLS